MPKMNAHLVGLGFYHISLTGKLIYNDQSTSKLCDLKLHHYHCNYLILLK